VRPLDGVTVVSVEQAVAAPFATRQLADLGARVIKVERTPDGDFARRYDDVVNGMSSYFVWLNRSKESLRLDLKHPMAADVMARLLDRADVFVQNLAPGAAAKLGLGAAAVREGRPSLIVCDVSGYGSTGPYRDKKAYDLLVQCETGLVSVTGTPDAPAKVGISVADIAGGMYAFSAVLAALYSRARDGEGAACEVSLFDAVSEWMSHPLYYAMYADQPLARTGTSHASIAPYGSFAVAGGEAVQLGVQNEREWRRFCAIVLERSELADDERFCTNSRRAVNRAALTTEIERVLAGVTLEEATRRLEAAGVANARLNDVAGLVSHPQLTERDRWTEVATPVGPVRALRPPVVGTGTDARMDPVPALGQHTDAILAELGFSPQWVDALRADGVV
jgi:itaconate CoA-transferase